MSEFFLENCIKKYNSKYGIKYIEECIEKKYYEIGIIVGKYLLKIFPNNLELINNLIKIGSELKDYNFIMTQLKKLLKLDLNENNRKIIWNNISKCIPYIKNRYISYDRKKIEKIMEKKENNKLITFTITTCKRYDLFEKTINSFINCCKDINIIDEWLLVDDNSTEEDRNKMKKNYPFFSFYFKRTEEKGHPKSMNIIKNKVDTAFIFHMEDDWQFFHKDNYISNCLEILTKNDKYGQCLLNKNYGETEKDINIIGGISEKTISGIKYFIHEYCKNEDEYKNFYKKHGEGLNSAYWKHFSFRPSLIKKYIFDMIGDFNEKVGHFEQDYSNRYFEKGFLSVFLDGINCLHIGRLTSEINDFTKKNAYILNDEKQFDNKYKFDSFVINLDRNPDRLKIFNDNSKNLSLKIRRFNAIDGKKILPNEQLQRIFQGNDYNMRSGMVACALSHMQLWIDLINSDKDFFLIFEDDISFVDNFDNKFNYLLNNLPLDWDICYLGHTLWNHSKSPSHFDQINFPIFEKKNDIESLNYSMGGTFAYLISKKGAFCILDYINLYGMTNCIDTMQQKAASQINLFYTVPLLVYSNNPSSNIQSDFSSLDLGRVPNISLYPDRLKIYGRFDISHAISYKNTNTSTIFIPISEMSHVSETIQSDFFPFDKTDQGNIYDFVFFIKKALTDSDINITVNDFISNDRKILFPHEKPQNLFDIYKIKFQNLLNSIKSNNNIFFIHATRFDISDSDIFFELYNFLSTFNKNIKILTINGIEKSEILLNANFIIREYLDFPDKFNYSHWDNNKIIYDQTVFRPKIKELILKKINF